MRTWLSPEITGLVFYDDVQARSFQPFALSRPLSEMRVGALLMRERWETATRVTNSSFVTASHLVGFSEPGTRAFATEMLPKGTVLINSRAAIQLDVVDIFEEKPRAGTMSALSIAGEIAAILLNDDVPLAWLAEGTLSLSTIAEKMSVAIRSSEVAGVWLNAVWDVIRHLSPLLVADISALVKQKHYTPVVPGHGIVITGEHGVWTGEGAIIEPYTFFDTTAGPVLVRHGASIQAFTRVVGPFFVGPHSSVGGDRVAGCSIGDHCRVHGEISASVMIGHSNKGHDGFVGHSVLGRWVNLGAGTTTSNLKNTYGNVALWTPDGIRDTGLQFLGTLFGDHVKTGIGLMLTTGCVLGTAANVFDRMPPKVVAPFAWGSGAPYDAYEPVKFIETAERAMSRRHVEMTEAMRQALLDIHQARWRAD